MTSEERSPGRLARFAGREVDERQADFRRDVACVLDDEAFFPSLTAREHLLLTARGHGAADAAAVVDAEVAAFGIANRVDALPSRLSSAQRRRPALAAPSSRRPGSWSSTNPSAVSTPG